ncbi:MAG: hypothetical protein OQK04_14155 [Kangiellaceae bacterium]|nr:hypothetical protein [Kangiellaceae bacterium]MCW8999847.1 hypothetical protein [Kangiellaceae bacterium]
MHKQLKNKNRRGFMGQASTIRNRIFQVIGGLLILSSIIWLVSALVFSGQFSMLIFTNFVVGIIFLLIGTVKPKH